MGAGWTGRGGIKGRAVWQEVQHDTGPGGPVEGHAAGVELSPLQEKPSRCSS